MDRIKYCKELKARIGLDPMKVKKRKQDYPPTFGAHENQISICMKRLLDAVPVAFSNGEDKDTDKIEMPPHDEGIFEPQRHLCKPQTDPTLDGFNGHGVSSPSRIPVCTAKDIRCILIC